MAFPLGADGNFSGPGKLIHDATEQVKAKKPGLPDGLKVDAKGNLFATGPDGVFVFAPDGTRLGRIVTSAPTANLNWGEDGHTLFIAADHRILRLRTTTSGKVGARAVKCMVDVTRHARRDVAAGPVPAGDAARRPGNGRPAPRPALLILFVLTAAGTPGADCAHALLGRRRRLGTAHGRGSAAPIQLTHDPAFVRAAANGNSRESCRSRSTSSRLPRPSTPAPSPARRGQAA